MIIVRNIFIAKPGNAYQVAVSDGRKIREVGKIFAGTSNASRKRIDELLAAGEKPVAEVQYLYATDTYTLFQPVFRMLRDDKAPKECGLDQLVQTDRSILAID